MIKLTTEKKNLLLKDLCCRLTYGVKVQIDLQSNIYPPMICKVCNIEFAEIGSSFIGVEVLPDSYSEYREFLCKPYLLPMSSMTEEQKRDLTNLFNCTVVITEWEIVFPNYYDNNMDNWNKVFNWCYKNHFDCNGLIPLGLALKAPDGMYN
jgi:hypothetical protein